ncbi:MAG: glycoside hydrolase family 3 N-terminal domain-containing protein [bacterium]
MVIPQVGQLLMVGFAPHEMDEVRTLAAQGRLGGVILFQRNATKAVEVYDITRRIVSDARGGASLLVAVDQEHGRVCRIREGVTLFPGPSQLGLLNRPATTARVAKWVAKELLLLGINLNLAPVADLPEAHWCPPVLEGRSFSTDPLVCARHVAAWVRGSQEGGVASCAKHFPGHGSVVGDTHKGIQEDVSQRQRILGHHLIPFRAAVKAGAPCVMISHVVYPALDSSAPASLSRPVVEGLLRRVLGFRGVALTDDLDMGAVASRMDTLDAILEALGAGVDVALVGRNLRQGRSISHLVEELEKAVRGRHISPERVRESMERVRVFKSRWISPNHHGLSRSGSKAAAGFARRLMREVAHWGASSRE